MEGFLCGLCAADFVRVLQGPSRGFRQVLQFFFLMGLPQGFGLLLFALYLLGAQGSVHLSAQCFWNSVFMIVLESGLLRSAREVLREAWMTIMIGRFKISGFQALGFVRV